MSPPGGHTHHVLEVLHAVKRVVAEPFANDASRLFWPCLFGAFGIAVLVERRNRWALGARVRWLWRAVAGPSGRVDLALFVIGGLTAAFLAAPLSWLARELAVEGARAAQLGLGPGAGVDARAEWVGLGHAATLFVLDDASRYGLHRLLHRMPWLWRVHRVHHAATVMTPLTFKRLHPVEVALFALRYALVFALVSGACLYLFRDSFGAYDAYGASMAVLGFHWAGANLRHSHVRWSWGGFERFVVSPSQHQIHHSRSVELQSSNFGSILAVWDWMFGTLRLSRDHRVTRFGLSIWEKERGRSLYSAFLPLAPGAQARTHQGEAEPAETGRGGG